MSESFPSKGVEAGHEQEQSVRESLFLSYVNEQLLDTFEDVLCEFDDADIEQWREVLSSLDEEHLNAFLAVPHELLRQRVEALLQQAKDRDLEDVVRSSADRMYEQGYRVGFHCSGSPNSPKDDPNTGREVWTIDGSEPDHRDGDIGMAYYSLDMAHLYHRKKPQYIYLVRAHVGSESGHRQDNDGSWGRAPKLDVITMVDYQEALSEVDKRYKAYKEQSAENGR